MCNLPNSCFDKPTLEEILQALKEDGSDWALKQIEVKTVSSFLEWDRDKPWAWNNFYFLECSYRNVFLQSFFLI